MRNRALRARGLADTSPSPDTIACRLISRSRGCRLQVQTGCSGGHRHSLASSCRYRFTILSSSEWKAMTANRPPGCSRCTAWGSAKECSRARRSLRCARPERPWSPGGFGLAGLSSWPPRRPGAQLSRCYRSPAPEQSPPRSAVQTAPHHNPERWSASSVSSRVLTRSAAEGPCEGSMRMSSGPSC